MINNFIIFFSSIIFFLVPLSIYIIPYLDPIAWHFRKQTKIQRKTITKLYFLLRCVGHNTYLIYLIINIIFFTDWLEEMDDDDRMEFEGKLYVVSC